MAVGNSSPLQSSLGVVFRYLPPWCGQHFPPVGHRVKWETLFSAKDKIVFSKLPTTLEKIMRFV